MLVDLSVTSEEEKRKKDQMSVDTPTTASTENPNDVSFDKNREANQNGAVSSDGNVAEGKGRAQGAERAKFHITLNNKVNSP